MPFITKQLSKEIMKRSRLRNKTEQKKMKFFIIGKEFTVCLFCENLREDTLKT